MKKWHSKEFSKLAQVSVRTLHHYDKIGLLQPSLRQDNNYRLYTEKDLMKLQQIVAMKFFGFELAQIKKILHEGGEILESLSQQALLLNNKAEALAQASQIMQRITDSCSDMRSIPWRQVIELIEVYHMTQQLQDSWVKDIFTPEELKEYAQFESELMTKSTAEQKAKLEDYWHTLVKKISQQINEKPNSAESIKIAEEWMNWVNGLYGKKYAHLRTKKFEKGFGEGKGLEQHGLTPEIITWLEKAMNAYWQQRIELLLAQVETKPSKVILDNWHSLMDEIYGEEESRKQAIPEWAIKECNLNMAAVAWLKENFSL